MGKRILILDDPEKDMTRLHAAFVVSAGEKGRVTVVRTRDELDEQLEAHSDWECVVIDLVLDGRRRGGLPVLRDVRKKYESMPVVMVVAEVDAEYGSRLLEEGATDYLIQGERTAIKEQLPKINRLINIIEENRKLKSQVNRLQLEAVSRFKMIGRSPRIKEVIEKIEKVGRIPRPVLITGQRGTGKELVARAIHEAGTGQGRPIVVVNCAAFTDELLDSTLFGHEKGAFTNAMTKHIGKFEEASGGTLFLDEIGNMSITFQQKIMRVVEYGTMRRLGGTKDIKVTTRIIAATNADLKKKMEKGEFMRDLYDRLTFEIIDLPPLSERKGDIPLLANFFLDKFMEEIPDFRGKVLSKEALTALESYPFPGNIRELKNIIERAVYRDTTNEITPEDLDMASVVDDNLETGNFDDKVTAFELRLLRKAMKQAKGNQAEAARLLGLSYHQLRYYLTKKYKDEFE